MVLPLLFTGSLQAQDIDEEAIRALIESEVNRLINTEGALDEAIQKGIDDYIQNQKQAAGQSRAEQYKQRAKSIAPVDMNRDHVLGNPEAAITMLEYSDFECPYCKLIHPVLIELLENNRESIRWVYRHFPLDFHNPGALKQAEAAECVADLSGNDAFWKFTHAIYQRTGSNGKGFPLAGLRPLAEEVGVAGEDFTECLDSGRMGDRVHEDVESGKKAGVLGTPVTFIMNRNDDLQVVTGAARLEQIQAMVDELAQ